MFTTTVKHHKRGEFAIPYNTKIINTNSYGNNNSYNEYKIPHGRYGK